MNSFTKNLKNLSAKGYSHIKSAEVDPTLTTGPQNVSQALSTVMPPGTMETATVVDVFPDNYTVTVSTMRKKILTGIPLICSAQNQERGAGDLHMPRRGDQVLVSFEAGFPCALGGIGMISSSEDTAFQILSTGGVRVSETEDTDSTKHTPLQDKDLETPNESKFNKWGGMDAAYKIVGITSYRAGRSRDVIPGDQIWTGSEGNGVAIFEGGVTRVWANSVCQLLFFKMNDTARMVTRNWEHYTDLGEYSIRNLWGHVVKTEMGSDARYVNTDQDDKNADKRQETGPKNELWRTHFKQGAVGIEGQFKKGKGRTTLNLNIPDPTKSDEVLSQNSGTKYQYGVDPDSKVTLMKCGAKLDTRTFTRQAKAADPDFFEFNDYKNQGNTSIQDSGDTRYSTVGVTLNSG